MVHGNICDYALQRNIIHGKSCLTGNFQKEFPGRFPNPMHSTSTLNPQASQSKGHLSTPPTPISYPVLPSEPNHNGSNLLGLKAAWQDPSQAHLCLFTILHSDSSYWQETPSHTLPFLATKMPNFSPERTPPGHFSTMPNSIQKSSSRCSYWKCRPHNYKRNSGILTVLLWLIFESRISKYFFEIHQDIHSNYFFFFFKWPTEEKGHGQSHSHVHH